jgi:serine/threonine protein kinase
MIKLRHPRIIELYKFSIDKTNAGMHIYMVMQRMQGDLSSYKFKNVHDKIRVIKQIVEGLRMLHE